MKAAGTQVGTVIPNIFVAKKRKRAAVTVSADGDAFNGAIKKGLLYIRKDAFENSRKAAMAIPPADKDGIAEVLSNVAKEKPDLTIALVHWGSEYKDMVTDSQEKIAKLLQEGGADVVLGTHPHMLHRIDFDDVTGKLVA